MRSSGPFDQPSRAEIEAFPPFSLVKAPRRAHDGRIGEKPLSIDEAPVPTATVGVGPAGGFDAPPGVKYGGDDGGTTATTDAPGVAGAGQPIPGIDVIVKKKPHG